MSPLQARLQELETVDIGATYWALQIPPCLVIRYCRESIERDRTKGGL